MFFISPESILVLIVILAAAVSLVLITTIVRSRAENGKKQKEEREAVREVLDRVGVGSEMTAFLNSEGGKHFLRNFGVQQAADNSREGTLRVMTVGIILACFGIGTMLPRLFPREMYLPDFASVVTMIGIGMIAASATSLKLRKIWDEEARARERLLTSTEADRAFSFASAPVTATARQESRPTSPVAPPPSQESPDSPHGLG